MAVLIDVSQILISGVCIAFNKHGDELDESMIRNMFLNSIKSLRSRYILDFGEPFILCFDGKGYWRKDVFEFYKYKRAAGREASPMDWELIFSTLNKIYDELNDYFPYHSIKIDGCEADDIISIMAKYFNTQEFRYDGVMLEKQKVLIVSNDMDFIQLQAYDNVSQYSPMKRKFLCEPDPIRAAYAKFISGDTGDGIVNMFTDGCVIADPDTRQTSARKKITDPILESLCETGELPADLPEDQKRYYARNKMLIDLVDLQLPQTLIDQTIERYMSIDNSNKGRGDLFNYFLKFNLKNLLKEIDKF